MGLDNNLLRIGLISSIDPANVTARVVFTDKDNLVSYDLPILVPNTAQNKYYHMPDIGEQVVCCFLANGIEQGFIIGSCYSDADRPRISDPNKQRIDFADGGYFEYDRHTGICSINAPGGIIINAPKVNISGDAVIGGISFLNHVHGGVTPGGSSTDKPK